MRVLAKQTKQGIVPTLIAAFAVVLMAAGIGCASDDAAASQNTPAPTATTITIEVTQAPIATVAPTPEPSPTTAAPQINLSEDEQVLLEMHKAWSEARANVDTEHFNDGCLPELAATDTTTPEEMRISWIQGLKEGGIAPGEWGTGEPSVMIFGGGTTAIVQFAILRNDEEKHAWAEFYTKHDGKWFDDCIYLQ